MSRYVRLTYILFVAFLLQSTPAFSSQNIGILPFKDKTGYDGSWDIEKGIAVSLGEVLAENPFYQIIPIDSLLKELEWGRSTEKRRTYIWPLSLLFGRRRESAKERAANLIRAGERANADVLIVGEIDKFSLSRFRVGIPMFGGYESYSSTVELRARMLRVVDGKEVGVIKGLGDVTDRDLGLTLFGKMSEKAAQFYGLDQIAFGSKEFRGTVLGRALDQALEQLKEGVENIILPPPVPKISEPAILLVDGDQVYINIGSEDGVKPGDRLYVYREGEELRDPVTGVVLGRTEKKVGVVQVVVVRAAHLSRARIAEGQEQIRPGDRIRIE